MLIIDFSVTLIAILMALLYLAIGLYAWHHHTVPGAAAIAVIMLAGGSYAVPYVLQFASPNLQTAIFWYNVSLPGASILGPAWLVFALQYTQQKKFLTPRRIAGLALVPAVTCLMAWTNPLHGLYGSNFSFNPRAAWPMLEWKFGLFYWINFAYAYLMTATGSFILVRLVVKRWRIFTHQTAFLLAGIILPVLLNITFVLGYTPIPHLDTAPFSFLITGVMWSLAIFRYRFLDLVPVARDRVIEKMPIGVVVLDDQERVVDANPAAAEMLQISRAEALGQSLPPDAAVFQTRLTALTPEGESGEMRLERDGETRYLHLHIAPLQSANKEHSGYLLLLHDITRQKQVEVERSRLYAELEEIAVRDELTGALNRRGFLAQAEKELNRAQRLRRPCAVVLFDLDHYKKVNDAYGHSAGDLVLKVLVRKCFGHIRETDILGRYGGDEFVLFLTDCTRETARQVCERLRKVVESSPIRMKDGLIHVTISAGITTAEPLPEAEETPDNADPSAGGPSLEDLLESADRALYAAKESGRNCVRMGDTGQGKMRQAVGWHAWRANQPLDS